MRKDFFTLILGISLFISFGIFESTAFAQIPTHTQSNQTIFEKIIAVPFKIQEQVVDTIRNTALTGYDALQSPLHISKDITSSISGFTSSVFDTTSSIASKASSIISDTSSGISSIVSNSISTTATLSGLSAGAVSDTAISSVEATSGFFKNSPQSFLNGIQQGMQSSVSGTASVFVSVGNFAKDVARGAKYVAIESYCSTISLVGFECGSPQAIATSSTATFIAYTTSPYATLEQELVSLTSTTSLAVSESNSFVSPVSQVPQDTLITSQQSIATVSDLYRDITYPLFDTRAVSVPYLEGRLTIFKNQLGLASSGVAIIRNSYSDTDRLSKQTDQIYDSMRETRADLSEDISNLEDQVEQTIANIDIDNLSDISLTGSSTLDGDIDLIGRLTLSGVSGNSGQVLVSTGVGNTPIWADVSDLPAGNAVTLNSIAADQFLRSDTSDSFTAGTLTFDAGTTLTVNGTTTLTNLNFGGDVFTDLTGTGLVNSAGVLGVAGLTTSQFASTNISQWTNDAGYLTGLSAFTTDDVTEGSTNLYSQWSPATGGINYLGGNVGIGRIPSATTRLSVAGVITGGTEGVSDLVPNSINLDFCSGCGNTSRILAVGPDGSTGSKLQFATVSTSGTNYKVMSFVDGKFGIGTSTPSSTLSVVSGSDSFTMNTTGAGMNAISSRDMLWRAGGATGTAVNRAIYFDGDPIIFRTAPGTIELMRILTNGNVGIGTTTPSSLLHIYDPSPSADEILFNIGTNADSSRFSVDEDGDVGLDGILNFPSTSTTKINLFGGAYGFEVSSFGVGIFADRFVHFRDSSAGGAINARIATESGYNTYFNTGNVGIGTTTPLNKLHIEGGVYDDSSIRLLNSFGANTDYWTIGQRTIGSGDHYLSIEDSGINRLSIDENGNVGIGINTPNANLTINSMNTASVLNLQHSTSGNTALDGLELSMGGQWAFLWNYEDGPIVMGTNNEERFKITEDQNVIIYSGGSTNYNGLIFNTPFGAAQKITTDYNGTGVEQDLILGTWTNRANQLTLATSGNVGIGTTNPDTKLNVVSDTYPVFRTTRTTTGTANILAAGTFKAQTTGNMVDGFGIFNTFEIQDSAGVANAIGNIGAVRDGADNSGSLSFLTYNAGIQSEKMRIKPDGNVGIGTTAPATKLHVSDGNAIGATLASTLSTSHIITTSQSNKAISSLVSSNTLTDRSVVSLSRTRGTLASPTAVTNNDFIGDVLFGGYDGSTLQNAAGLFAYVDGTVSSGNVPMRLSFVTGTNSSTRAERLTIKNDGNVGIGTTTPTSTLTVNGDVLATSYRVPSASAAIISAGGAMDIGISFKGINFQSTGPRLGGVVGLGPNTFTVNGNITTDSVASVYTATGNIVLSPGGSVGIGTTTPSEKLTVNGNARFTTVTSGAYAFDLNLTAEGTLTTSASDERLKRDIIRLDSKDTLDRIMMLEPSSFVWKEGGARDLGLIAQEVEIVFPELVFTNGADGFKGINYSRLPALLISAVQEVSSRVDSILAWFTGGTFNIQNDVCVDDVCVTKEEFKELLRQAGGGTGSGNTSNISDTNTPLDTPVDGGQPDPSNQTPDTTGTENTAQDSTNPTTKDGGTGTNDSSTDTSAFDASIDTGASEPVQDSSSISSGESDSASDTQTQESSQESSSDTTGSASEPDSSSESSV